MRYNDAVRKKLQIFQHGGDVSAFSTVSQAGEATGPSQRFFDETTLIDDSERLPRVRTMVRSLFGPLAYQWDEGRKASGLSLLFCFIYLYYSCSCIL